MHPVKYTQVAIKISKMQLISQKFALSNRNVKVTFRFQTVCFNDFFAVRNKKIR